MESKASATPVESPVAGVYVLPSLVTGACAGAGFMLPSSEQEPNKEALFGQRLLIGLYGASLAATTQSIGALLGYAVTTYITK